MCGRLRCSIDEEGSRLTDGTQELYVLVDAGQTATGGVTNPSQFGNHLHGLGLERDATSRKLVQILARVLSPRHQGQEGSACNPRLIYRQSSQRFRRTNRDTVEWPTSVEQQS